MFWLMVSTLALADEPTALDEHIANAQREANKADTARAADADDLWRKARGLVLPVLERPETVPRSITPGALSAALQVLSAEAARGPRPSFRAEAFARLACGISDRPATLPAWAEQTFDDACRIRPLFGQHDLTLEEGQTLAIDGEPAELATPVRAGIHLAQTVDASGKLIQARWFRVRASEPTLDARVDESIEDLVWASVNGERPEVLPSERFLADPSSLEDVASPDALSAFWQLSAADATRRGADLSVAGKTMTPAEALRIACAVSNRPLDALSETAQTAFVDACGAPRPRAPIDLGAIAVDEQVFVDGKRYEAGRSVFRGTHLVQRRDGDELRSEWVSNDQDKVGLGAEGCSRRCRNTRILSAGLLVGAGGLAVGAIAAQQRYRALDGASDFETVSSRSNALVLRNSTGVVAGLLLISGGAGLAISGKL